jgi:hypothetical protein
MAAHQRSASALSAVVAIAAAYGVDVAQSIEDALPVGPTLRPSTSDPDLAAQYRAERAARKAANFAKRGGR